jgi:hypothetical protein
LDSPQPQSFSADTASPDSAASSDTSPLISSQAHSAVSASFSVNDFPLFPPLSPLNEQISLFNASP